MAINAPINFVWHQLTSPSVVTACTPGIISWEEQLPQEQFLVNGRIVIADNGPQWAVQALIHWYEQHPPTQLKLRSHITVMKQQIEMDGRMNLTANSDTQSSLAFFLTIHLPLEATARLFRPIIAQQMPPFLQSFFRCLKNKAETAVIPPTSDIHE
ncbi:MAG TPA: SRPBCC family protein [Anaerolineae bacterium]|nr:SRPBCC family protein [Anaerolineae bacterium]